MKNKTFKRLICFLLALVVMVSLPLDLQANAVATESWMLYALITYLAGMGISFTVAGGVNAMIQAMEEKVKDYEQGNNVIDFYEYFRNNNIKFVPNNNQDPDGNNFFDLFFTASAVEAIQTFANWLTQNGWGLGETYNYSDSTYVSTAVVDGVETTIIYTKNNGDYLHKTGNFYHYKAENLDFVYPISLDSYGTVFNSNNFNTIDTNTNSAQYLRISNPENYNRITVQTYGASDKTNDLYFNKDYNPYSKSDVVGFTVCRLNWTDAFKYAIVFNDGTFYTVGTFYHPQNLIQLDTVVDVITPEEFAEQFPDPTQGVSIKDAISVPMGDPSLNEWAKRVEQVFIQTGTIPQPQPQVVIDPDFAPQPTPVPTPVPTPGIEDIDDLGLPTLGEAIFNKFPFSLPKDLKRIADILNAEPVTPFWEVDLFETLGNRVPFVDDTTIRIDLAEYEALGQISRWASVITFVIFLVIITKGVIRW